MDTKKESILPTIQHASTVSYLAHMEPRTLLPNQLMETKVKMADGNIVLVEGWHSNENNWPYVQLCTVKNGKVTLEKKTNDIITLGGKGQIKTLKISKTEEIDINKKPDPQSHLFYKFNHITPTESTGREKLARITFGKNIEEHIKAKIDTAHLEHANIFNDSLIGGYNHYFGKHLCKLNWATQQRPHSNKLRIANYSHDLNGLMQEVIDDLTRQKVMLQTA
jgi:hypothetical protein